MSQTAGAVSSPAETGVIGRRLVPQLVAGGHQVTGTTTSAAKLGLLQQLGAEGVVVEGLDAVSVGAAVAAARPDAIVNEMTGLSEAHAGRPNLRKPDRFFAATNRLRTQGTDHLLAATEATGVTLDILDGQIRTIRSVSNPDELEHVGPVADAWAVAREVNQARSR